MKIKFGLLVLAFLSALTPVSAQRKLKKVEPEEASKNRLAEIYADSLLMCRQRIDSMKMDSGDSRYAQLFTPLTFYHGPAARMLRLKPQDGVKDSLGTMLDQTLMEVYLKRPDLVRNTESHLKEVGAPLAAQSKPKKNHPDIVEQVAPKAIEVDAAPMDIVITRPNFWTIGGDYYLQFLQNYVSDNWYKGGESNYSVLGRVTMFANYNNKQKVKWDGNRRREKRNASLQIRNSQLEREQLELGLKADLSNLWQAYRNNLRLLNLERQNLVAARENHEIAKERYLLGDLSGIEMREAQKSLLDAEERILSAEYNTKVCEISLLQLSGRITKYLE
jgi:hypothetical protein